MVKRRLAGFLILLLLAPFGALAATTPVRISVFNFETLNLESLGLGANVTNMLIGQLGDDGSLAVLDRKELESFLALNDLQQNDRMDNVVHIGSRLGLNFIVVGSVEKKGAMIVVACKVIRIDQKKVIMTARASAVGDAALAGEVRSLAGKIKAAISQQAGSQEAAQESLSAPAKVRVRPGSKNIFLTWEASSGAAGYEVFRAASEGGPFSRLGQVTRPEFLDETVERDTRYFYKIRAYNSQGLQSPYAALVEAMTAPTPSAPVILKAEGRVKAIELTWSPGPPAEDPSPLKGYKLYRSAVEEGPYQELATLQSKGIGDVSQALDRLLKVTYRDAGLKDGAVYYYRVTAFNTRDLESAFSRPIKGTVLSAVESVAATGDMIREIRLTWKPITSEVIRGYFIYRGREELGEYERIKKIDDQGAPGKNMEYTDKDRLADATRYYYKITAFQEDGQETAPSKAVSAVTRGRPARPEGLVATSGLVKKVELAWSPAPGDDVEGYNLYWSKDGGGKFEHLQTLRGRGTNRFTDSARGFERLADGATYFYRLTSFNKVDVESEPSQIVSATTKPRPVKPAGLEGEGGKARAVPLKWRPNPEKDIVLYHLFRAAGQSAGEFERIAKVTGTVYADKDLKDDTLYHYRLQAEDKDGLLSDLSEVVSLRTKARPARPGELAAKVEDGRAVLTWKAPPQQDIAYYTVYEKRLFGAEKITTVRETAFSEAAPAKGKTKVFLVTATDGDGLEGEASEVAITGI